MNYFCTLIYILIFSLIIYFLNINLFGNKCEQKAENFTITNKEKSEALSYLKILSKCMINNKIPFWIIGGTTLGSVRHGEMIPWDDDADIGVFENDMDRILEMNKVLNDYGYEIAPFWRIYKFRKIGQIFPFVDIFCYFKSGNEYLMNHIELRNKWPNEYYDHDELFPLRAYKFGNLTLPGPNYPLDYLDRLYPRWQYIAQNTYDHKKEEHINEEMDLNQKDPEHKLKPHKIIKINKKQNLEKFMRKKYNKYHDKKVVIFEN